MNKYKESQYDYPEPKPSGGGGGFRRFLLLVAVVAVLAFLVASWSGTAVVTENHGGGAGVVTTATATAPAAGVAVNVEQSAPSISVNVEQAAPPPAAMPTADNTVAMLAYQNADRALLEAATANRDTAALLPRVAALETKAAAPPTPSAELELMRFDTETNRLTTGMLTGGFFALLVLVMALAGWVTWSTTPRTSPRRAAPTLLENQHGANTVLHGADTVQQTTYPVHSTTSGDILRPLNLRPRPLPMPKRLDELTDEQRRYIQQTYNRLKTFSGTSRHIWNYHNATTLGIVKDVVGQGDSQRLQ
jgi:hypothetical protein